MSNKKNVPDDNDIEAMIELESQLANEAYLSGLTLEQRRGKEILLRNMKAHFEISAVAREKLAQQFDPNYVADPKFDYGITKEERARRDEARRHIVNWSKLGRGRSDA